jgi:DNA helicase-2/ATP-dependent DNA helicase PcrA
LRLLYVGITRARRELIITYNTGRDGSKLELRPALALEALQRYVVNHPAP